MYVHMYVIASHETDGAGSPLLDTIADFIIVIFIVVFLTIKDPSRKFPHLSRNITGPRKNGVGQPSPLL
jgi:hypothetical protein